MRLRTVLRAALAVMTLSAPAHAQILGSFSWQMQPYCNIVTFTVIQQGERYQLAGTDNLCGAGGAPVVGTAVLAGADVALGFTVNLASGGAAHVSAAINLSTLSGPWADADGNTGTFLFGANTGGSPRPAPASGTNVGAPLALTSSATEIPLSVVATASGTIANPEPGIYSLINNPNAARPAVKGVVNSIFGNFGTAGIFGESQGTGGMAGLFHASNPAGNGPALVAITNGNGNAISANASKNGNAVEANIGGAGNALYAWVPTFGTGRAIRANNYNSDNTSDVITATTVGNGIAVNAKVDRVTGISPAVRAEVNSQFSNFGTAGIYGISSGTGGFAGLFHASNPAGNGPALVAIADGNGNGITANASNNGDGVETTADGAGNSLYAWKPTFALGRAIRAVNYNQANASDVVTVQNQSTQGGRVALRAVDGAREARLATAAYAAYFVGNVHVLGNLSKSSGTFKIDHPLDPENRYLSHSFVESPEMKNVYDGVVTLDADGAASVTLPNWFETLNSDFRYQLTAIGGPAPSLHVSRKIANGQFAIAGGTAGIEVSWQVTGIRKDPSALHNPIVVETDKPVEERGYYLDPAAYGLPEEKGVAWATNPRATEADATLPASAGPASRPALAGGSALRQQ